MNLSDNEPFVNLLQGMARDIPRHWDKLNSGSVVTRTECGALTGITVSLIDGIIAMTRVLNTMDLTPPEVQEALKDLRSLRELKNLIATELESSVGRISAPITEEEK